MLKSVGLGVSQVCSLSKRPDWHTTRTSPHQPGYFGQGADVYLLAPPGFFPKKVHSRKVVDIARQTGPPCQLPTTLVAGECILWKVKTHIMSKEHKEVGRRRRWAVSAVNATWHMTSFLVYVGAVSSSVHPLFP